MTKKIFWVPGMATMLLTFAIVLAGCAGKPFVYDESVAPEQSSTLRIWECQVFKFNGEIVSAGKWSAGVGEKTVIIPAGNHTLEVWSSEDTSTKFEVGKVEMTHTFLPGHTYLLTAPIENRYVEGRIIDIAALNEELVPDSESPNATPLEGKWVHTKNEGYIVTFAKKECTISINGEIALRGSFTYTGKNGTINNLPYVNSNRGWRPYRMGEELYYSNMKFTYDGTAMKLENAELKKQ
jgi:hypothetical protein